MCQTLWPDWTKCFAMQIWDVYTDIQFSLNHSSVCFAFFIG